jgi:hypothetical protein
VTLPEVVMGNLAGKFGEISLYNQHADFELGSNSNSNPTSPWAIVCESATQPSRVASPLSERFARGPRYVSMAHAKAPTTRRAGKEIVPSMTMTPTPSPSTTRTPTLSLASTRTPPTSSTSSRTLMSQVREQHYRATPVRTSFRPGYNIHTRREIRLLARPQARRPDRRELTLRRLPRLTSLPGGNTACSRWGAHSDRGDNQ